MPALDDVRSAGEWPPAGHRKRIQLQSDFQRLYRNRRDELIQYWSDELRRYIDDQEDLVLYPSAQVATRILAAFLFGEDPTLTIANDQAQAALDLMSTTTVLPARLHEGAITQAVQGEVYLKVNFDEELSPVPIVSAVPGRRVIPTFRYGMLVDAAVISSIEEKDRTVWRLVEYHEGGLQQNVLFRGTSDRIGSEMDLADGPVVWRELDPEVETEIETPLIFHVPFQRDSESPHGVSVLDGKEGLILAIHRLYSVEQHDAEIARKRVAIPESYLQRNAAGRPTWDRRDDVMVLSEEAAGAVGAERAITPIEFHEDEVGRKRVEARLREFLIACGIAPQTLGENAGAGAESGRARKLAQGMTLQTVSTAARYWQDALSRCAGVALEAGRIHLGMVVPAPRDDAAVWPVAVELADGLVDDSMQDAEEIETLDRAEAISTEQKVRRLHPDWEDADVDAEVERILEERGTPPAPPPIPAMGDPDEDADADEDADPPA